MVEVVMVGERTAFVETARLLGRQVREAEVDHEAFDMPLKVCELTRCRATCCHDGVVLGEEEVRVIEEVINRKAGALMELGWEGGNWLETKGAVMKTATRAAEEKELPEGFPAHFPKTRCRFLNTDQHCVLQALSMREGRHQWFWKPISCWMQPLRLERKGAERPQLTLAREGRDPLARAGYPGFSSCTPCGSRAASGERAGTTLRAELEQLGALGDRNLAGELA